MGIYRTHPNSTPIVKAVVLHALTIPKMMTSPATERNSHPILRTKVSAIQPNLINRFREIFREPPKNISFRLHFILNCLIFGWFRFSFSPPREGFFVSIWLVSRKSSRENRVVLAYYERASVTTIWSQRSLTPKIICIMQKKTYKSINLACTCKRNSQPATLAFLSQTAL